jgi:hypothetical protein
MHTDELNVVEDRLISRVHRTQADHFEHSDANCRAVRMPDGVLLRYTLHPSLFFFLGSENIDGFVITRVYASDTAYERQKIKLGEISTPMFDQSESDPNHLQQVESLLRSWMEFVTEDAAAGAGYDVFAFKNRH